MKKILSILVLGLLMAACGGEKQRTAEAAAEAEADFAKSQPVESGLYNADYFDITGATPRKGSFDGRVLFSISPDQSAVMVYENGNRTKINHLLMLQAPFEKTDSVYTSTDANGKPVTLRSDSTFMQISYVVKLDTVTVNFNPAPRNTYTPLEALEKIQEQAQKK